MLGLMLTIPIVLLIGMAAKFTDLRTYLATVLARAADKISIKLNRGEAHDVEFEEPKLVLIAGQLKSDGTITGPAADGKVAMTETSAAAIAASASGLDTTQDRTAWPTVQGGKPDTDVYLGVAQITLVGGSKADNVLVPAVAAKYGVIMPFAGWSDTADTYTFAFQDEDNTALTPALCTEFNVTWAVLKTCIGFGGATTGPYHFPWFKGTVVNKALECDITGGAGAEKIVVWFWYWYESA